MIIIFRTKETISPFNIHVHEQVKYNVVEIKEMADRFYYRSTDMKEAHYYQKALMVGPPIIIAEDINKTGVK